MLKTIVLVAVAAVVASAQTWTVTQPSSQRWYAHVATLLDDGRVLVSGNGGVQRPPPEIYDPATDTWRNTGPMVHARLRHAAVRLRDGRVLAIGGGDDRSRQSSAEIYDPATNAWTATTDMHVARTQLTATLLRDGRVLVAGGLSISGYTSAAEIYDPVTATWTVTGSMAEACGFATATLLADGRVLIAGGLGSAAPTTRIEIYDPVSGTFSSGGALVVERVNAAATVLRDGRVLFAGGSNSVAEQNAEIYDVASATSVPTLPLPHAVSEPTAVLLPDGRVLLTAAVIFDPSPAQIFDPASGMWTETPRLRLGRIGQATVLLPSGRVFVVGGIGATLTRVSELFDYAGGAVTTAASMPDARTEHSATPLDDTRVFVVGGRTNIADSSVTASTAIHDRSSGTWTPGLPMSIARRRHTATRLADGRILVAGGFTSSGETASASIYDPASSTWTPTGDLLHARAWHRATLLSDGRVLVTGGVCAGNGPDTCMAGGTLHVALRSAEIYDPRLGTWSAAGDLAIARVRHTATLLPDGRVLVTGHGHDAAASATSSSTLAEIYTPTTGIWSAAGDLIASRAGATATLLDNGRVLIAGGEGPGGAGALVSAEIYDPLAVISTRSSAAGDMSVAHTDATATKLLDGMVIVAGGGTPSIELFDPVAKSWRAIGTLPWSARGHSATLLDDGRVLIAGGLDSGAPSSRAAIFTRAWGFDEAWRPRITSAPATLTDGSPLTIAGERFATTWEASGGGWNSSATNFPIVQVRHLESEQTRFLPVGAGGSTDTSFTSTGTALAGFPRGPARLTVFTNGIPSLSRTIVIDAPSTTTITSVTPASPAAGASVMVTFSVAGPGGGAPAGIVTVTDGTTSCTAAATVGQCTLVFPTSGPRSLIAKYDGDALVTPSQSAPIDVNVGPRLYTLAEGATGDLFDTYVLVANPNTAAAPIQISFLREDGTAVDMDASVPPLGRFTQRVDDVAGVEAGSFAIVVASLEGGPLFVERATYVGADYHAGHVSAAHEGAQTTWQFAEGIENDFFDMYLLIGNAGSVAADVTVTYLIDGASPITRTYVAPASGRLTIDAAREPELAGRAFGMRVTSTVPVTAERAVYFGDGYVGAHASIGTTAASTAWLFAEGATSPVFDAFLLLANPGSIDATATVTYHTETGATMTRTHVVPANGRTTIAIDGEDAALAWSAFWIAIAADRPIVAERAMYWSANVAPNWIEGHVSAGASAPASRWGFAEGIVGGGLGFRTYLLVANPGDTDATVEIQFLPQVADATPAPLTQTVTIAAGARDHRHRRGHARAARHSVRDDRRRLLADRRRALNLLDTRRSRLHRRHERDGHGGERVKMVTWHRPNGRWRRAANGPWRLSCGSDRRSRMTLEQTMAASAVNAWTLNVDRATKLFADASEERLLVEIAPGKNRLVYLFGHLIAVHDAMRPLLGIGPRQYAHLDAAFLTGADKAVAELPSRSDLQRMWAEVHGSLLAAFNAWSPADWIGKHTAVSDEDFAKNPLRNRLSVLMSRTNHLAYHLGQCVLAPKS